MDPTMQQMQQMPPQGGQAGLAEPAPDHAAVPPDAMGENGRPMKPPADESQDIPEVERGLQAITEALYKNDETANAFVQALKPEDPVGSLVKTSIQLITEIDNQLNLSERSIAPLAVIACGELMEIGEAAKGIVLEEKQQQQVVMATWEGILSAYGVAGEDAVNFAGQTSEQEQSDAVAMYEGAMQ